MSGLFFWLTIGGFALTTFAAIAALVLNEIPWHELEEYCKNRRQPQRFSWILKRRDSMLLGSGILQLVATAVMSVGIVCWFLAGRDPAALGRWGYVRILMMLGFSLVFSGSWIPWAVTRIASVPFLFHTYRFWWGVSVLVWPLMAAGEVVGDLIARASGVEDPSDEEEEEAFEDEILSMVSEGQHDGFLESNAREMIEGIIELDDYDVTHIMTPRTRVDALEESTDWDEMMEFVVQSGRTRIPIYRDTPDHVLGLLYAKDLLRESLRSKPRPLAKLLREPLTVPFSMRLDEMLKRFLHGRTHMAIVQDEYGGMAGVVTIEDVLEEIVGEIVDETDTDMEGDIEILNPEQADVNGGVHIEHLNDVLGIELPEDDDYVTVSGLIMSRLNEIPRSGHELVVGNIQFSILNATRRQIKSVRVTKLEDED